MRWKGRLRSRGVSVEGREGLLVGIRGYDKGLSEGMVCYCTIKALVATLRVRRA